MCCRAASSICVKEQQASHSHRWWIHWKPLVETLVLLFVTSQKQLKKFILQIWVNLSGRGFWIWCIHSRNRASSPLFFLACLKSLKRTFVWMGTFHWCSQQQPVHWFLIGQCWLIFTEGSTEINTCSPYSLLFLPTLILMQLFFAFLNENSWFLRFKTWDKYSE